MPKWDNKKTEDLFGAILKLKTKPEAKKFLRDLFLQFTKPDRLIAC